MIIVEIDVVRLRTLYSANPAARAILDHFASRERNWQTTTVDRIQNNVTAAGGDVSRGDVINFFKELEECRCGIFKTGRKGWPSRFEWTAQMVSVGQAAAGETEQVEEVRQEDIESEDSETLRHVFFLRPDMPVTFELPRNLSPIEASRLADFIKTLPFEP